METAFPLKLYLHIHNPASIPAEPRLSDELRGWLNEVGITDFKLEWRQLTEDHPYYEHMPKPYGTPGNRTRAEVVDTWILFTNKRDATLFKLRWGRYEGC